MYRLIHIEPDEAARRAVLRILAESPLPFAIDNATDLDAAAEAATARPVDAVLLGLAPRADALPLIDRCRTLFEQLPLIVVTETADLAFACEALRAGAQDVVVKHDRALAVLSRILLYAIERAGAAARRRNLEIEAATSRALLDALFANTSECFVQVDEAGTIERSSGAAARLIGLATPPPPGCRLVSRVHHQEAARLTALLDGPKPPSESASSTFRFAIEGTTRLLEVQPLRLDLETGHRPHLLKLTEIAADFAGEIADESPRPPLPSADQAIASARAASGVALAERRPEPPLQPGVRPQSQSLATPPMTAVTRPLALIEALARTATWRVVESTGDSTAWGFLVPDPKSVAALARLAAISRDDPDIALACDRLRLRAWKKLVINAPGQLPALPALELGYGTSTSGPHLGHFLGKAMTLPGGLGERWQLCLSQLPKGVYVPTLVKTIRAIAERGKPALQLPDLAADYRQLPFGQLALLILDVGHLKAALARDSKAVAALFARAGDDGCRTMVRGASGPLAEALRSRLGIDLTVDG